MNKEKMERLREVINKMICLDDYDQNKLLEKSQEMDKLIVQAVKENIRENNYGRKILEGKLENKFNAIINKIQPLHKIYDSLKIVDPLKKEVVKLKESTFCKIESECYKLWKRQRICDNCIAVRACNRNDTIIKIEYDNNKIYMITAIPISIQNERFAVELFKDVTNNIYID
mgnify:CR=1 FL=1